MRQVLFAGLAGWALVACAASQPTPVPTISAAPTQSVGAQPTPVPTAPPTPTPGRPSGSPSASPAATSPVLGWSLRSDALTGPPARTDHTWTVDPQTGIAYLFGGRSDAGVESDLWAFDLATDTWTQLQPEGDGPAPRFGHTATWVPSVGLVVWSGQGSKFFDDIWAYDPVASTWQDLPARGAVPEARYGSCAALGPDGRLWISHGFTQDDGRFADTRAYDFATGEWTDMTPAGERPVKRCLHDCFWAPNDRLILYGGQTTGVAALGDLWAFDATASAWEQGVESSAPPRQLYALGVGPDGAAMVFGGGDLNGGFLGDTWALDWTGPELHQLEVGPGPGSRSGAAMIVTADRILLFGGTDSGGLLGDLWELVQP